MPVKLMAFAASTRQESYNRRLLPLLVEAARAAGAEVDVVDLAHYPLPLYHGDDEAALGMPGNAAALLDILAGVQGLLVVTPEYNGFFPPLLKNTLDWMSRPDRSGQPGLRHFKGKVAAIASASPGPAGGLRSLLSTRQYLSNLGLLVIPEQIGIGSAATAFEENGKLKDNRQSATVSAIAQRLVEVTGKLA